MMQTFLSKEGESFLSYVLRRPSFYYNNELAINLNLNYYSTIAPFYHWSIERRTRQKYGRKAEQQNDRTKRPKLSLIMVE